MPIRYSGAPYIYTQFSVSTRDTIVQNLRNNFVQAGWTEIGTCPGYYEVSYGSNNTWPDNNGHITIVTYGGGAGSVTKEYQSYFTAPPSPEVQAQYPNRYYFQVGANADLSIANLVAKINTTDTLVTASQDVLRKTFRITNKESGPLYVNAANSINVPISMTHTRNGGYVLRSGETPQGLRCRLRIGWSGETPGSGDKIRLITTSDDEKVIATNDILLAPVNGRLLEFIGCKYQWFTWLLNSTSTVGCVSCGGVPFIRAAHQSPRIINITNNAGQVQVTLSLPHGCINNDHIFISQVEGFPELNDWWQVTIVDTHNYVLQGSTYQASWTPNTGLAGKANQIVRCFWSQGSTSASESTWRYYPGGVGSNQFTCLNQFWHKNTPLTFLMPVTRYNSYRVDNFGDYSDIIEPRLVWPPASPDSEYKVVAEMWNSFIMMKGFPPDTPKDNFDGFNWMQFVAEDSMYSLWLAKAPTA